MKLIDTHSHIYSKSFDQDRETMLETAVNQGVTKILMPNVDLESVDGMLDLESRHPNFALSMMGLHPCSVKEDWEEVLEKILEWFEARNFIAVGEIGIDLYWDKTTLEIQSKAFRRQVQFAIEKGLPIVIHSRSATPQIMDILREFHGTGLKGVFHCFSESFEFIDEIDAMGFYFGIGGVLTYKNSGLTEVLPQIPRNKIILETDAPYLAPVPFRGKRNEPAYVWHVAKKMAETLEMTIDEVGDLTCANAKLLFGLAD